MKRIRLLAAAAALAAVGALSASAATVSAGPDPARISGIRRPADPAATPVCPRGDLCGWTGKNYSGTRGALEEDNTALPTIPWHEVQSVWNDGRHCSVWLYRGTGFNGEGGQVMELLRRTGYTNMLKSAPGLYKHVYSNHWCTAG
jgi:hypothetical protein